MDNIVKVEKKIYQLKTNEEVTILTLQVQRLQKSIPIKKTMFLGDRTRISLSTMIAKIAHNAQGRTIQFTFL